MGRQSIEKERIKDPKKRAAWIEQLLPHFIKFGIRAVPIDQVGEILGKSKATLYKHFESHEEIVGLVIGRKLADLQHFQSILSNDSRSYQERYMQAVAYISKHLGDVSNLFLQDLKAIYPDLWQLIQTFKVAALAEMKVFYVKGTAAGTFADLDPDLMVLSDELFFDVLTDPEYLSSKGLSLQEAFDGYFKMRFYGILRNTG